MIEHIKLRFGRGPGVPPETIATTPVTVFVGPNNSGKSKVLAEIHEYCATGNKNANNVILDTIQFQNRSAEDAEAHLQSVNLKPRFNEMLQQDHVIVGKGGSRIQVHRQAMLGALESPISNLFQFCRWYLAFNTLILDGKNRINLVNDQGAGDLHEPAHSSLQLLFRDDQRRAKVRQIVHDAFGLYFVIDPTSLGRFRIRLSSKPPITPLMERGIHEEAVQFHAEATPIEQASDGVKAFTGIMTEVIAGDPRVLLIDEPEAFLHPSLTFKLGKEIAQASLGSEKRLFVSTHSADFVMGCIQSGAPVSIVRLTYRDGVATAKVLPNTDILKLMRNPLLRSTGVLSGLFYEFVLVTESDADRAFYQEVNERLLRFKPKWGIPNCLFLNAQNKQTVQTIIRPLRELGIPAAGIVDVDVIKDGGAVWTSLLSSMFVPEISHQSLSSLRVAIKKQIESTHKNMKRDGGVAILSGSEREAGDNLFDQLAGYGLFVVRGGELESWLSDLRIAGHGPNWLIEVFERMGEDPTSPDYVLPNEGDVWSFMNQIKSWLTNPNHHGIPV